MIRTITTLQASTLIIQTTKPQFTTMLPTSTTPQLITTSLLIPTSTHKTTSEIPTNKTTTRSTLRSTTNSEVTSDIITYEISNDKDITGEKRDIEALAIEEREAAEVKTKIFKLIQISPISPRYLPLA